MKTTEKEPVLIRKSVGTKKPQNKVYFDGVFISQKKFDKIIIETGLTFEYPA